MTQELKQFADTLGIEQLVNGAVYDAARGHSGLKRVDENTFEVFGFQVPREKLLEPNFELVLPKREERPVFGKRVVGVRDYGID